MIEPGEVPVDEACVTDADRYWHLKVCSWSDQRSLRVFAERPDAAHSASCETVQQTFEEGSERDVLDLVTDLISRCATDQERANVGAYEVENLANLRPTIYDRVRRTLDRTAEGRQALSVVHVWGSKSPGR